MATVILSGSAKSVRRHFRARVRDFIQSKSSFYMADAEQCYEREMS